MTTPQGAERRPGGLGVPARVRLSRTKGFRLQQYAPGAIVVRRPTRWGNPFTVADALADDPALTAAQARQRCAEFFDLWLDGEIELSDPALAERRAWILEHIQELEGHPLACTCPEAVPGEPDWCHAVSLIRRSNPPQPVGECGDGLFAAPVRLRHVVPVKLRRDGAARL